ncbi:MAG TPA: hypothetical protein VFJ76_02545 [Solirubrobacterales bacterium]|nr:hypothetical protein [Solirubrobacterales bacterium]
MEDFEGRSFDPTNTYPSYAALVGGEGSWTKFSFTQADLAKQATSSTVEASGSVGGGWGLLSFGGGANYKKHTEETSMDYSSLELEVEIMRASIERPWLDPLVFRAHSWRFKDASKVISDGGSSVAPGQAESGALMPLLPTGVLVARKLKLKNALSHEDMQLAEEELKVHASIGWGPFSLSGSYGQSSKSFAQHSSVKEGGIEVEDPQVIGFFCDALPLCPSPNPQLWEQG